MFSSVININPAPGGPKPPTDGPPSMDRRGSDNITTTHSAIAAFGDDIADDAYSVSEMSHYDEDKISKKISSNTKGGKAGKLKFPAKSKLDRKDSVPEPTSPVPDPTNGHPSTTDQKLRKGSTGSAEKSDEASSPNSGEGEDSSDITITTFASFAQNRFQVKIPHTYSCSALPQPLLPKADKADHLASLATWVTILRVMGDLPDVDVGDSLVVSGASQPVVSRIRSGFSMKYTKKDMDEFNKKYSDLFKDPYGTDTKSMPFFTKSTDTMLDKIQMICAMGIYKPSLRDELYCQLCKQLTGNPSRNSSARGWVLMNLMVSSFAPSERFMSSLTTFLQEGPVEFADRVDLRLRRTCSVGTRGYPPSWLEFQAAKNGKPLLVPITFMNGHRMLYEMDGATTVGEVVSGIAQRLDIKDPAGFSIYITLQNKISCLGSGSHRVMDAVSECEQHSKMMGVKEANSNWRLFMRREFFAPWQIFDTDPVATDLEYHQITKGITMGEYQFEKEDQLLNMAAMIYTVEFPEDDDFMKLVTFLTDFIPENILERRAEDYFLEKVKSIVQNNRPGQASGDIIHKLKTQIIQYSRKEFHVMFSRFYEASRVVGGGFQLPDMVIGVNHKGLFLIDNHDKIRLQYDFCQIVQVSTMKNHAIVTLIGQEDLDLTMNHVEDFYELVKSFLQGLTENSTLALACKDLTSLDDPAESNILKGDLLELSQPIDRDQRKTGTVRALCTRTGSSSDVPVDMLYVLTTLQKPKKDVLSQLVTHMRKDVSAMLPINRADTSQSLQRYAKAKFRPESESSVSKFLSKASFKKDRNKSKNDALWQYSKETIKKPLLKKTLQRDDVKKLACHTFTSIQTYMANLVINDEASQYNLCVDWVLDPARRNKYTRDEVYCQVIKQLTDNPDKANEEKGWVLLTLLSSLILPSQELLDYVVPFMKSSKHPLASRCVNNIKLQTKQGAYRLYSAHFLEHAMVCNLHPNIRIPVYFPNQTTQTIEVTSQTRIYEMKKEIATRLRLNSFAEYSLFMTTNDKVHCLLDRAFFFDCLSHAEMYWFKGSRRHSQKSTSTTTPMVVMLKKIWVNAQPGEDTSADTVFHYPQEVPNYLRGYHGVHLPNQVTRIAALMYRALYGDDASKFANFSEISSQLFPLKYLQDKNAQEVCEGVKTSHQANKGMSPAVAKAKFLDELSSLTTYGSVFFEVKQRHVKSLPPNCLLAINFAGVHILDKESKKTIRTYEFVSVPNWAYDEASFTFIFSEGTSTSKLLVETKVGHNIDDLLMSYIAWIMNFQMRKKFGYVGQSAGESIC